MTVILQGGSNMTGTVYTCLHTNQSRSYLDHLVYIFVLYFTVCCILSVLSLGKIFVVYHVIIILRQLLRKYPEEDRQLCTEVNKVH